MLTKKQQNTAAILRNKVNTAFLCWSQLRLVVKRTLIVADFDHMLSNYEHVPMQSTKQHYNL